MSGYNMPDGVSPNMIPGNRPEDVWREEIEEKAWTDVETIPGLCEALGIPDYSMPDLIWERLQDMGDIHERVAKLLADKRIEEAGL